MTLLVYWYNTNTADTLSTAQQQKRHAVEYADVCIADGDVKQPSFGNQSVKEGEKHWT